MQQPDLTPDHFTTLTPAGAREHLRQLRAAGRWSETDSLTEAWWRKHQTALESPHAEEQARVAALPATRTGASAMLVAGRVITALGLVATIFFAVVAVEDRDWSRWASLFSSFTAVGVLLWVAGALEQRLIEIRLELAKRP